MPSFQQARSVAVPRMQTTSHERTTGEVHSWMILTNKMMRLLVPDVWLVVLVATVALVVKEWMFMHKFHCQLRFKFKYFEDRVVDCIG